LLSEKYEQAQAPVATPTQATEGRRTLSKSNVEIIREAYQNFAIGNIPAVFAAFDASISWHVPGHGPLSGDYSSLTKSEAFFSTRWTYPEAHSASMYTMFSLMAI
jgi:hypothetical protein